MTFPSKTSFTAWSDRTVCKLSRKYTLYQQYLVVVCIDPENLHGITSQMIKPVEFDKDLCFILPQAIFPSNFRLHYKCGIMSKAQ
jgi:hypothetical protein